MLSTLVIAALAAAPPPRPVQQQATQKYKLELSVRSEVDLSGLGAPSQTQEQSAVGFLSVTLSDSAGGKSMRVVIDSATINPGEMPVPADLAAQTRGATFHAFVDPLGQVQGLTGSSDNALASMIQSALGDFFPRTRPGATPGQQWGDTLNLVTTSAGNSLNTHLITSFTAGGNAQYQGIEATTVAATFTTSVTGTMETPAGAAGLAGQGSGTGNYYISRAGVYLGGTRTTTQASKVTLAGAPVEIPVQSTTLLVVTPIP